MPKAQASSRPEATHLFSFEHLPTLAPWVHEQIVSIGRERIADELRRSGEDTACELPMASWVAAIQSVRQLH